MDLLLTRVLALCSHDSSTLLVPTKEDIHAMQAFPAREHVNTIAIRIVSCRIALELQSLDIGQRLTACGTRQSENQVPRRDEKGDTECHLHVLYSGFFVAHHRHHSHCSMTGTPT